RHVVFGKEWMVHAKSQLKEKEKDQVSIAKCFNREIKPLIQPTITEIHNRLGLDFFGIDCYIDKEMDLLAFEINTNMNILILSKNAFVKHAEAIQQALVKMLTTDTKS
ncbi:MAG: hypothetical protein ABFQ64_11515, partial [Campylobacterota bacterium]